MKTPAKLIAALICLCALAAAPAQAKSSTYYTKFEISIQGQMTEKWSKAANHGASYGCPAREEASGGTTIEFATEQPYRLTAGVYGGWHGRPPGEVSDDPSRPARHPGASGTRPDLGGPPPPPRRPAR